MIPPDFDRRLPDPGADEQGEVPCPDCDGSGYEYGPTEDRDACRRCDGEGVVSGSVEGATWSHARTAAR